MAGVGPSAVFAVSEALYAPLAARQVLRARQAEEQAAHGLGPPRERFHVHHAAGAEVSPSPGLFLGAEAFVPLAVSSPSAEQILVVVDQAKLIKLPERVATIVVGNPLVADLSTLPHLLIAGRTGTGKSVCLNAIITSILMTRKPDEVRLLLIDPKMVELSGYSRLPHLMHLTLPHPHR